MNPEIRQFEDVLRNASILEGKIQNKETRTGIPREEYQKDKQYKTEVEKKNEEYKNRAKVLQFIKPEPSLFNLSSSYE